MLSMGTLQLSGIIDGRSTIFNASKDDSYSPNGSLAIDIHLSFFIDNPHTQR